jgi:hypothetical protein
VRAVIRPRGAFDAHVSLEGSRRDVLSDADLRKPRSIVHALAATLLAGRFFSLFGFYRCAALRAAGRCRVPAMRRVAGGPAFRSTQHDFA